jgi:VCBS repeat-containing protein
MGATIQAAGQWIFTPYNSTLQIQGLINGFQPFSLGIAIQSQQGNSFYGTGTDSYGYILSRS